MKTTTNTSRSLRSSLSIYQDGKVSLHHVWAYMLLLLSTYEYVVISAFMSFEYPQNSIYVLTFLFASIPFVCIIFPIFLGSFEFALSKQGVLGKSVLCIFLAALCSIAQIALLNYLSGYSFWLTGVPAGTLLYTVLLLLYALNNKETDDIAIQRFMGLKRFTSIHTSSKFNNDLESLSVSQVKAIPQAIFTLVTTQTKEGDSSFKISSHLVTHGFHRKLVDAFKDSVDWEVSEPKPNSVIGSHLHILLISISCYKGLTYRRGNTVRIVRKPQITNTQIQQQ